MSKFELRARLVETRSTTPLICDNKSFLACMISPAISHTQPQCAQVHEVVPCWETTIGWWLIMNDYRRVLTWVWPGQSALFTLLFTSPHPWGGIAVSHEYRITAARDLRRSCYCLQQQRAAALPWLSAILRLAWQLLSAIPVGWVIPRAETFDHRLMKNKSKDCLKSSKLDPYEICSFFHARINWRMASRAPGWRQCNLIIFNEASMNEWPQELQAGFVWDLIIVN